MSVKSAHRRTEGRDLVRLWAPGVPYVAMFVGLHVLSSGWASILLYHAGIIAVLVVSHTSPRFRLRGAGCRLALLVFVIGGALSGPFVCVLWPLIGRGAGDLAARLHRIVRCRLVVVHGLHGEPRARGVVLAALPQERPARGSRCRRLVRELPRPRAGRIRGCTMGCPAGSGEPSRYSARSVGLPSARIQLVASSRALRRGSAKTPREAGHRSSTVAQW